MFNALLQLLVGFAILYCVLWVAMIVAAFALA